MYILVSAQLTNKRKKTQCRREAAMSLAVAVLPQLASRGTQLEKVNSLLCKRQAEEVTVCV